VNAAPLGVACEVTGGLEAAGGVEQLSGVLVELAASGLPGLAQVAAGAAARGAASSAKNDLESARVCGGWKGRERPRGEREIPRNFE
jgi:hypothetical protein